MSTEVKKSLHEVRFPGESDQYRRARDELLQSEIDLRRQIEAVAAQRRKLPLEEGCPSCTSIIGAIDGEVPDITHRINFAVIAKVPIERFRAHAKSRGWRHARLLSSASNTYNRDYRAETPDGSQHPMATVFARRDGKIHHFWSSELYLVTPDPGQDMRHVDFMWPLWLMLDRTPEGRGTDWRPELDYGANR